MNEKMSGGQIENIIDKELARPIGGEYIKYEREGEVDIVEGNCRLRFKYSSPGQLTLGLESPEEWKPLRDNLYLRFGVDIGGGAIG